MAAKTWESDFRYAAICASIKALERESPDDVFNFPGSLCLPIAKKPVVGWSPGKIFVIFLILGFALLGSGAFLVGKVERDGNRGNVKSPAIATIGCCMAVTGITFFFLPILLDRHIVKWLIGSRAAELTQHSGDLLCAEISDTNRAKMSISIDGDDYVLALADYANHRLLIDGIAARYMVRAQDVTDLRPFEFLNYVGAEITFRINEETSLSIAIARVSMLLELIRQVPILFFLRRLIRNRILQVCSQALQIDPSSRRYEQSTLQNK